MSEEKINIKKSMLSPDVAPFVPRNFNVNYYGLSNYHSEINDTGFITNLSGIEIPQPSKWESPIIYPASFLHNPIYPFTHVIAPECSFQTAPIIDSKCFVSTIESEMTNKSSFQPKKHHASRKSKKYVEISEGNVQSNPNVQKKEKKKKGNSSSKTNQISSDLSNFKIKSNCSEHKQIKSRTDTNETPVKFDSNIEFPTLPSISNKTDSVDENKPLSYNSSYSSVLKFESKTVLKLDKTSNNKFPNKSIHVSDNCKNIEKSDEILHNADKKHEKMKNRNFSRTKNVSKNKEHFQQGKNQIDFHQRDNIQISEPNKVLQKNSPSKDLSKKSNTPKEEKEVLQVNAQSVENKGKETLEKPEKTKKKRRNKKKKKTDGGKVSLLSPEMFAAITKQFVKSSEYKYNNFNLSDAEEFPDLGSTSSKNNELSNTHNDTKDKSLSSKSVIKNQAITPEIVPDSTHISSVDSWKYSTFSSILKMNNPPANSVNKEEIHKEKLEDNSIIQKEEPSSSKSKKASKKKKKNKENANSTKSVKQEKVNPSIELSLTEMITSLQLSKSSHKKKKDVKPRVISTKRGIMDKMLNPHNILDSSAPMKKRGKEREQPNKKRISAMRKVILKEREKRKQRLDEVKFKNAEETKSMDENSSMINDESKSCEETVDNYLVSKVSLSTFVEDKTLQAAKLILHTRKFRDYCNHMLSEEIDCAVKSLLKDLIRFQDRLHQKDPVKARMKRRLVQGLREVTKHLRLSKLKCIIIAPDIEKISAEGGLNDALQIIINLTKEQKIPCVFALQRRTLGKLCMKSVPVSCVGIFNYEGSEENFRLLSNLVEESKNQYEELLKNIQGRITKEIEDKVLQSSITDCVIQSVRSSILRQLSEQSSFSQENTIEQPKTMEDST